jgi:hypothetical protein
VFLVRRRCSARILEYKCRNPRSVINISMTTAFCVNNHVYENAMEMNEASHALLAQLGHSLSR